MHYMEIEIMSDLGILQVIDDSVFVCMCKVFSGITKTSTSHEYFNDIHFVQKYTIGFCGAIIDNITHAPICVL